MHQGGSEPCEHLSVVDLLNFLDTAWWSPRTHPRDLCSFRGKLATCPAEGRLLLCLKLVLLGAPSLLRVPGKVLALEETEETRVGFLKKEMGREEGQLPRRRHTLDFSVTSQAEVLQWPFLTWP